MNPPLAKSVLKTGCVSAMLNDDDSPIDVDQYYFIGKHSEKRPKLLTRITVSLTPDILAYVRNFHPIGRYVSSMIRSAPAELIRHYQRKIAKEKRKNTIQGKPTPFDISLPAYTIYTSIPKRLRSAFVRDCIRAQPSMKHVMLTPDELDKMKEETAKSRKKAPKPKKKT